MTMMTPNSFHTPSQLTLRQGNIYGLASFNKGTGAMEPPKDADSISQKAANVVAPNEPVLSFYDAEGKPLLATGSERDLLLAAQTLLTLSSKSTDAFVQEAAKRAYEEVRTSVSVNANFIDVQHIETNKDQFNNHKNITALDEEHRPDNTVSEKNSPTDKANKKTHADATNDETNAPEAITSLPEALPREAEAASDAPIEAHAEPKPTLTQKPTHNTTEAEKQGAPKKHPAHKPTEQPRTLIIENSQLIFNSPNTSIEGNTQTGSHAISSADVVDAGCSPCNTSTSARGNHDCPANDTTEVTILVSGDALKNTTTPTEAVNSTVATADTSKEDTPPTGGDALTKAPKKGLALND
jgi:hypothetical protein